MKISSITQAEDVLREYIPNASLYFGDNMSLDRMWPLLELVGNPHSKLSVIHLAGTSGKTSTAYYISALLKTSGSGVGMTVSPHVDSITERVQIDGKPVSEQDFCNDLGEFIEIIKDAKQQPSYFELMIVFVLWEFVKHGVDYAVIETGLGGLLDGTNVVTRNDKVCVITDIGIDHTNVLGNTLSSIAQQKAGIIHEGNQVFMYKQSPEIMNQIDKRVEEKHAELKFVDIQADSQIARNLQFENLPKFQKRNFVLAGTVARAVADRDSIEINMNLDPLTVVVPGRMEQRTLVDGTTLIMDGAHNKQKMTAFVESYQEMYPGVKATVALGLKESKDFREVIDILEPITDSMILTTFNTSQDLPAVSQDPAIIEKYTNKRGIETITIKDHNKAYAELVKKNTKNKIITGSFYLLGQIRQAMH